jgi:hypothetical protein
MESVDRDGMKRSLSHERLGKLDITRDSTARIMGRNEHTDVMALAKGVGGRGGGGGWSDSPVKGHARTLAPPKAGQGGLSKERLIGPRARSE